MFISISIFLGVISYSILQIFNLIFSCYDYEVLKTFEIISSDGSSYNYETSTGIPYFEVISASFFGVVLAYLFAAMDTYLLVNKIGIFLKLSVKETDETLYASYLSKKEIDWVYIRDLKNNLTYLGKIFSLAEKENIKELVLEEATVYSYPDSIKLYEVPSLYLSFNSDQIIIEQAKLKQYDKENDISEDPSAIN
jgi:hypothetical protein